MNRPALIWGVTGTAVGTAIGYVIGRTVLEGKVRAEYQASSDAFRNAMMLARNDHITEAPAETEEELDLRAGLANDEEIKEKARTIANAKVQSLSLDEEINAFGEGIVIEGGIVVRENEPVQNDYHKAISATETPVEMFVDGGVNDYGCSYIEEEDYQDEDGRLKLKIDIFLDDQMPRFMMDGQVCDDWDKRVGDSILVDFFNLVPPGAEPVLYVRNHRTDEDYEVVRVEP